MSLRFAVVGGGAAGVAAAWAARKRGAQVRLFHGPAGATELASGTADLEPWSASTWQEWSAGSEAERSEKSALSADEAEFLRELGYWQLGPAEIATSAGIIRPCLARDPSLLDLHALQGRMIAVADVERDDWDGPALARTLASSQWAERSGTRFEAVQVPLLRHSSERRIPLADFAALHDGPERRNELCARLEEWKARSTEFDALLLGPWLGLRLDTTIELRSALRFEFGECTSLPGGPSGYRFAAARTRLLGALDVEVCSQRVRGVREAENGWNVFSEDSDMGAYDAVLLAVGGLVSGGLEFRPQQDVGAAFGLTLEAPVLFSITGEPLEQVSSTYGFDPMTARGAWIERAGVLTNAEGSAGPVGLLAAGDVVANAPRTILRAVRSAIAAVETCFNGQRA